MDSIIIENVTYQYPTADKATLKNVSLKIKKGELCAIIGANGSGKTALCNAIRGFIPAFYGGEMSGRVVVNGTDIATRELGDLALDIGYVFQNPFTQVSGITNTVYEELAFGLQNIGVAIEDISERIKNISKLTKIEQFLEKNPYELSGGQLQRVAFASVLVMAQDILVIDEPTSQLDPQSTDEIFDIIKLMKEMGKTVVLVEHKMEQVAQYADHVVVMSNGEIVMDGTPKEVFGNPQCEQYCIRTPKCTDIARELIRNGILLESIPVTLEETILEVKKALQQQV